MSLMFPATPASAAGEITIRKLVNGERSPEAPGPEVPSGTKVRYRYVITVMSSEPLYDLVVTDTGGVSPDCDLNGDGQPDGYNGHPGPLSGGSQFACFASETAGEPGLTKASIGRVKAYNFDVSKSFEADDVGHYTTVAALTTSSASTTSSSAAPTSAASTTDPATTRTSAEPATTAKADSGNDTSGAGVTSTQRATTQSTTLGGDSTVEATTANSAVPTNRQLDANSTTEGPDELSTLGDEAAVAQYETTSRGSDGTDSENEDSGNGNDVDDQPPSSLRFSDELTFSYLLALAAAGAGVGIALVSHHLDRRKRASAPGEARG